MTRRLAFALWLAALWVVLWEEPTPANVLSGLLVAGALVIAFPPTTTRAGGRVRPLAAARFVGYFAWKLAEASAIVAWEVVTPPNRINEGIVAIPVRG
ncbi:MAG: Na+/H+ antiporter subunit E, partial [Actinomycetota bacterium]